MRTSSIVCRPSSEKPDNIYRIQSTFNGLQVFPEKLYVRLYTYYIGREGFCVVYNRTLLNRPFTEPWSEERGSRWMRETRSPPWQGLPLCCALKRHRHTERYDYHLCRARNLEIVLQCVWQHWLPAPNQKSGTRSALSLQKLHTQIQSRFNVMHATANRHVQARQNEGTKDT